MSNVEAAVGLAQLKKYDLITIKEEKSFWYDSNLRRKLDFSSIFKGATFSHYTVRVPNRNQVIKDGEKYSAR